MPAHDVLIIGAGLAGQRAALAAAREGASVAIMSKVHPVARTRWRPPAASTRRSAVDDDWHSHAYDTVKGSDFLGDQDAIEVMCSGGARRGDAPRAHRRDVPIATTRASSTCARSAARR